MTLNRSEAIDPGKVLRTISYAHPVFTPEGARAQARHAEISGRNRTHYCGAYWGWGFHEDGVVSARARRRALRGAACDRRAMYDGHDPPPPLRGARARVPPPDRARLRRPRRAARCSAGRRRRLRSPRDYLGDREPLADARWSRAHGRRPAARPAARRSRARSATASTPSASTTASTPRGALDARRRRGDQHALGRAPRLRAAAATAQARARHVDKALHVSPFMGMDHALRRSRDRARRDAARCTSRAAARASCAFDATLDAAPAASSTAPLRRVPCATPRPRSSRCHLRPRARA